MLKKYKGPLILPLEPGEDPTIPIGASQGTSGDIDMFSFADDVPANIRTMIELNCDDIDYADMDTNDDYVITMTEFQTWYDANKDHLAW